MVAASVTHPQRRGITSAGQFNPIHDFAGILSLGGVAPATDLKEFTTMISNPGPVRVGYSPDYLDWYWKAYQQRSKGTPATGPAHLPSDKMGMSHLMPRVPHSKVRTIGEGRIEAARRTIVESSLSHGHMDMFERQSQFPVVHLENATDYHIRELYRSVIEPYAVTGREVWEKALLYTAMLLSRQRFYPDTMQYIFPSGVEGVVLAPAAAKTKTEAAPSAAAELKKPAPGARLIELLPNDDADPDVVPSKAAFDYFLALVRMYQVENAAEAAVVLRCHRHPNVKTLLKTADAVTDGSSTSGAAALRDLRDNTSIGGGSATAEFPPLTALVEDDANASLLRCLVFAELNCWGSRGSNPFVRHPNAADFVLRPHSEDLSVSLNREAANAVEAARGHSLYPTLPANIQATVEGRSREVVRLQQQNGMGGRMGGVSSFNQQLGALLDKEPAHYSADRFLQGGYNPRQLRSEIRDQVSRKMLRALGDYDDADTSQVHREPLDVKEDERRNRAAGLWYDGGRNERGAWDLTPPTVVHFVNTLMRDPHLAFLCSFAPTEPIADPYAAPTNPKAPATPVATTTHAALLRKAVCDVAEALYGRAREFHLKEARTVQHQKFLVAASVLDGLVAQAARAVLETEPLRGEAGLPGPKTSAYRSLGEYRPMAGRMIDGHGCPVPVKEGDYLRWMSPTPAPNARR